MLWLKTVFYLFFIFSFIFIHWRLITEHYCSGFCHTLTWISHGFTWQSFKKLGTRCQGAYSQVMWFIMVKCLRLFSWYFSSYYSIIAQLVKNLPAMQEVQFPRFNSRVRKIAWRWKWQPAQYFCLENPLDRGAWQPSVLRVARLDTT